MSKVITLRLTAEAEAALSKLLAAARREYQTIKQSDVLIKLILDAAKKETK